MTREPQPLTQDLCLSPEYSNHPENDPGRPYEFKDADTLLADFFQEVRRVLKERDIAETVWDVTERKKRRKKDAP